ncbi:NAD-P-binding protein [Gautieria morchelliformis]|nr:NAD-P-binding protein [Gautieria morchelliformis]
MTSKLDPASLFSTEGLVAVVTGGGTGIGLMMATALENSGATVYIIGRRKEVLEKAAKENAKHGKIIPIQGDVTSRESLLSIVSTISSQTGYINLLINNSGIFGPTVKLPRTTADIKDLQKILWEATPAAFQETFNVNVTAVYYTTVAFLDLLDKGNKHGGIPGVTSQVVTVSSIAGFRRDENPSGIAYGISKAAATHLGKVLANLLKDWRIRSNVIAPGIYPSQMTDGWGFSEQVPMGVVPAERLGSVEDMGGLILYLASRAGGYVNGNVSITDGGRLGLFSSTY